MPFERFKNDLPPPAFTNAINSTIPGFDFRKWRKSKEWKVFVAGYNEAVRVANAQIKAQHNMGEIADKLFGQP